MRSAAVATRTTSSTSPSSCADPGVAWSASNRTPSNGAPVACRVVFTDRHGGVSAPPFDSLNLADHVGDTTGAVAGNRTRLAARLGLAGPDRWVWLHQVHGAAVVDVDGPPPAPPEADAAVTTVPGLPLVVLTADCAPLALVAGDAVAVVHAGWHGLLARRRRGGRRRGVHRRDPRRA